MARHRMCSSFELFSANEILNNIKINEKYSINVSNNSYDVI